ncbi:MAG: SDR family NAD(P)-dependent oxidoreductase [Verrucomicrobiota bacterium]
MNVSLNDRVALVTGAAGAIGQAICTALADNGARVVVSDIDLEGARRLASTLPGAMALRMDVTRESEVDAAIDEVVAGQGRLDVLVNNAGINTMAHRVNIDSFPADEWDRILRVDLTGLFLVSRAASRCMLRQKGGRIINIASVLGLVPARLQCAFTAAKAGVVNLTRTMAIELGSQGILTNCIAPGSILSEGTRQLFYGADGKFSDRMQAMLSHVPLGRPGRTEEVAHAVLFLAAPESSYINGAVIPVDGGWLAGYSRDF